MRRYKLLGFVLSTSLLGLAGSLLAFLRYFVSADMVHVAFSGEIIAMTVIGGMGNFLGPPLGALFFILFREILSAHTAAWQFYFGLLFMAFILFSPMGLIGPRRAPLAPFRREAEEIAAMAARARPEPRPEDAAFPALGHSGWRRPGAARMPGRRKRFGGLRAVADVDLAVVPASTR